MEVRDGRAAGSINFCLFVPVLCLLHTSWRATEDVLERSDLIACGISLAFVVGFGDSLRPSL